MDELTGFQRDLLYVIAASDRPSGQQIREKLEPYYQVDINHGRLYPNLDTLVNRSLVQKGEIDRRTNYYDITETGERLLAQRRAWENRFVDFE